ncbi:MULTISPECIES: type VI secretion system Vgr family protein [unclassified Janthinobacterium]|uniref:type VI secretion system Vgr family protein n=1 Tax=unclassified Janthinobacterium TaxID=2610881 RepID=UPI00160A485E|nr:MULTISPECIES: type VI secretion system Vgr family protein [unclassified Janthinobacterium]MBB5610085.1 type VI secretion system secreted protein VgrG [Janthinobacterium sp. S3T4]MBB5615281.1 type VI secretion system secreted protein VgrG [Janthinobacterium sp. S3M3]
MKDFAQWMTSEKTLSSDNRPLRLRLAYPEGINEDVLLPQRISGSEAICGGIEYRILCVATEVQLALKQFIAVPAELQIVTDRGQLRRVCGIVAEACAGQSDGGLATYQLVLRDALALMEKRINTRVFRGKNELQVVQILVDEWRQGNSVLAASLDYAIDPALVARNLPVREFTMQHNESDAAFIRRLLRRRGIAWCFQPGSSTASADAKFPVHTLFLFDDASRLPQNAAGTVRYHRDDATEERDTVTAWSAVRRLQPGKSERYSWDEGHPHSPQFMRTQAVGMVDQGGNGNRLAASLDDYIVEMPNAGASNDDQRYLGQLAMARHDLESKCFQGEACVRDFCAGQWFSLEGHAEIDSHPAAERCFVLTAVSVLASNNLPKGLDARIERLFSQSGWPLDSGLAPPGMADSSSALRYRSRFTCVRRGIEIVPGYDVRSDLPVVRLQSALVVGPAGEEVHCDGLGRVKLRFGATRAQDHAHAGGSGASDTERDSAWVRVASSWAGNGPGSNQQCGTLTLPRIGTEVLVDFLGGDPDQPIIIGQLYNAVGVPPGLSQRGGLPGNRYLSGMRSREIKGGRGNQLRFDDTPSQISAQLASDQAATQLNLGYLVEPRSDGAGQQRGDGFELRSDASGSLRTARSLLISAWKRIDAQGKQLDSAEHLSLMKECLELFSSLGEFAAQHQALALDPAGSRALSSDIAADKATISITAPDGVALSTPKTVATHAGANIDLVAQQHLQLTAAQRCNVNAGKGISLFAHKDGIVQVAHFGKFLLQSQHDALQADAAKEMKLTAGTRMIGVAQDEITFMTAGGAYLKLSGGAVELGGPGALTVKTDGHHWNGPGSMKGDLPIFGEGDLGRTPRLLRPTDGLPVEGVEVHVEREGGSPLTATSGGDGRGPKVLSDHLQKLKTFFFVRRS